MTYCNKFLQILKIRCRNNRFNKRYIFLRPLPRLWFGRVTPLIIIPRVWGVKVWSYIIVVMI